MLLLLLLPLVSAGMLFSVDMVMLRDGTMLRAEVSSYSSIGHITMLLEDGSIASFPSKEVLSIEKAGLESRSFLSGPYIQFHEGSNNIFGYIPPRYTYRGRSYNVETEWGMETDIPEFFAYLSEEHPGLDGKTLDLIRELERRVRNQNISMMIAGLCIGGGTIMTFLPLNLDDIEATPPWAIGVSLAGFSLNVVGLGAMLCTAFINHREYPLLIAESFNAYIAGKM